ncbi:MAG: DUF6531 domain-containing protein [Acidovorax sp.]
MKKNTKRYLVGVLLFVLSSPWSLAQELSFKKEPKYTFMTSTVRSPSYIVFDNLEAAFAEVSAYYSSLSNHTASYQATNLRAFPGSGAYNGLPIRYMWDVKVTHVDGKVGTYEDWSIWRQTQCEQDARRRVGESEWVLYEDQGKVWCEKTITIPLDVKPQSCMTKKCESTSYTDFWAENVDGGTAGNPIVVPAGEKVQTEVDYFDAGVGGLSLERYFRSGWAISDSVRNRGLGKSWRHNE